MYANTKGINRDTIDMACRVNSLDELLRIDSDDDTSKSDG